MPINLDHFKNHKLGLDNANISRMRNNDYLGVSQDSALGSILFYNSHNELSVLINRPKPACLNKSAENESCFYLSWALLIVGDHK